MRREAAHDPALPFLADLAATIPAVASACAGSLPQGAMPRDARLVRHKPGRRCLVRYAFADGNGGEIVVYGKASGKRLDERSFRTQHILWQHGFDTGSGDGISVAEPLGLVPEFRMWLQRKASGRGAGDFLSPQGDPASMHRVAAALAKLHRADLPVERQWTIEDEMTMLRGRLLDTARMHPALADGISEVLRRCEQAAERLEESTDTGVHRDFYFDQVLVDGERVTLVDLDLCARGDAAIDVGNFIAHVTEFALRRYGDAEALASFEDAFLRYFLALSPMVSPDAVEIYAALSLARHISISLAMPERRQTTASLVRLSRERLDRIVGDTVGTGSGLVRRSHRVGVM